MKKILLHRITLIVIAFIVGIASVNLYTYIQAKRTQWLCSDAKGNALILVKPEATVNGQKIALYPCIVGGGETKWLWTFLREQPKPELAEETTDEAKND